MITTMGNPDADIAQTPSNVFIFCGAMACPGNRKADRKNATVVIRYIIDDCNEENPARCLSSGN